MANTDRFVERVLAEKGARSKMRMFESYIKTADRAQQEAKRPKLTLEKKVALATTLSNTASILREATNSSNIPAKNFYLDMLTMVVPNLIAPDIVSTQAMDGKTGMISYLRFLYGSDKGQTKAGTMFNNSLYTGYSDMNYTSRDIVEEAVADGINFEYVPIIPGTITVTLPDDTTYTDDGQGNLINPANPGASVGTINYSTGAFTCVTATDGSTATYEYNNEQVPDLQVPEISMTLGQIPIVAKSRKLAAYWGFDAAYDLKQQWGTEILDVLSTQAAGEISHEIDTEICMKLYKGASADGEIVWNAIPPVGVNIVDHYQSFWVELTKGAMKIFKATQRVQPNFIVCGTNVAAVIECMANFDGTGSTDAVGPHFIGTLGGKYKCYVVPLYDPNVFVMGYKGSNFLETGFVYAPYMPILSTDILMPADFRGQQGYATSYGTKMVNGKMYLKGRIITAS